MAHDIKSELIEEIALEGLDGITVNTLWIRLEHSKTFPLKIDDQTKSYLWSCVIGLKDIEFYKLSQPRPDLVPYDRFHYVDPETRHFLETEHVPDDIYPVNIINEDGVMGSCVEYKTRINVSHGVRSKKQTLEQIMSEYGNTLVAVATQDVRRRALLGPDQNPDHDFTVLGYCMLERIGRSRYNGEASVGKMSLQSFDDSSKTIFYIMLKVRALNQVTKQRLCMVRKPSNVKISCFLYHLNKFYMEVGSKAQHELEVLTTYLDQQPEKMAEVRKVKAACKIYDKDFKKVSQTFNNTGERYFDFLDIPWREIHPNATPKEYMQKNGRQEKKLRHIRFLKTMDEVTKALNMSDSSDDEEEPVTEDLKIKYERNFDKPYMYEMLNVIRQAGARGLSQMELKNIVKATKLQVRRTVNFLQRCKYLTTVLLSEGRQKIIMYVAVEDVKENEIHKSVTAEIKKYGNLAVEEKKQYREYSKKNPVDKYKAIMGLEPPTAEKVSKIKEELDRLDEQTKANTVIPPTSKMKIAIMKEIIDNETLIEVNIQEMDLDPAPDTSGKEKIIGMRRFGSMLTESHIRRANWIIEVVTAIKVVENFRLLKLIRNREKEMKFTFSMDQKSMKRLVIALVQERKIRNIHATITMAAKKRELTYLCDPSIHTKDETLLRTIDQAKLRYFSVSKEELKNRQKKMEAKASNSQVARKDNPNIPATAQESIQKHQEYRRKISETLPPMKYNRKAGNKYGLLPKMLRIQAAHQYLFHLCYDTHAQKINLNPTFNPGHSSSSTETPASHPGTTSPGATFNPSQVETPKQSSEKSGSDSVDTPAPPEIISNETVDTEETQKSHDGVTDQSTDKNCVSGPQDLQDQSTDNKGGSGPKDVSDQSIDQKGVAGPQPCVTIMDMSDKVIMNEEETCKDSWFQKEPHVYCDELTWRRYLSPVPVHTGYTKGWCLISDVLMTLPVSLFCQMVNVCYDIDGLPEILNHPKHRFYPVINLPFKISQQLLHSKKYIQAFMDVCCYMCEMGLLSFGKEVLKDKDQTFVFLHQKAALLDTRDSQKGYNKTHVAEGETFPQKVFTFNVLGDLHGYWENLQVIALGSNLGYKSMLADDVLDLEKDEVMSLKKACCSHIIDEVRDAGIIPGDRRGGAGLDSSLFSHSLKNWTYHYMSKIACSDVKSKKMDSITVGLQGGISVDSKRQIVDMFNKGKKTLKGEDNLVISVDSDKPVVLKKIKRDVKGNKGGRGNKRSSIFKTGFMRRRRREDSMSKMRKIVRYPMQKLARKRPSERGDSTDQMIYKTRIKQRVLWSAKEDSLLLMCRLSALLMDNNSRTLVVSYKIIRDYMHFKCGQIAEDKTSLACQRRLTFVLKNPQTEANVLLYFREALQDEFIIKEYVSKEWSPTTKNLVPMFSRLTEYILEKFQSLDLQKCSLPDCLSDLEDYEIEPMGRFTKMKEYKDVGSREHICEDVVRNILHSAVLLHDKQGRTHEMFKLLTQYPEALLSTVIKELRSDGLFVIQKKQYQKQSMSQLHMGIGIRNFKVSQKYMYNYKHRNLSTLFQESADFLTQLTEKYVREEGEDQRIVLDNNPKGGQSAFIVPLLLQKKLDFKMDIPDELVVVDMEGFYNFPWGRGKTQSSSTRADKSLQEMYAKSGKAAAALLALSKQKGNNSTVVTDKGNNSNDKQVAEGVTQPEHTGDNDTGCNDTGGNDTGGNDTGGNDTGKTVENDSASEGDSTSDTQGLDTTKTLEQAELPDIGTEHSYASAKTTGLETDSTNANEDNEGNDHNKGSATEENSQNMSTRNDVDDLNMDTMETAAVSNPDESSHDPNSTANDDSKKETETKDSIEGPENTDKDKATTDTTSADPAAKNKVTSFSNGSSEIAVSVIKYDTSEPLTESSSSVASRTFLSLRRAEETSFEDIRVFNAQDNFVVNSCKIQVKLREPIREVADNDETNTDIGMEVDEVNNTDATEAVDTVNEAGNEVGGKQTDESNQTGYKDTKDALAKREEYKKGYVDQILLNKDTIKKVWDRLQRLLPFTLDIQQVWGTLRQLGHSQTQLDVYRTVYNIIHTAGALGIRMYDLQKQFSTVNDWRGATEVLIEQAAILKVGVTYTRYVSLHHARPWVIHAYRNIKGRGLHQEEEGSNILPMEQTGNVTETIGDTRTDVAGLQGTTPLQSNNGDTVKPHQQEPTQSSDTTVQAIAHTNTTNTETYYTEIDKTEQSSTNQAGDAATCDEENVTELDKEDAHNKDKHKVAKDKSVSVKHKRESTDIEEVVETKRRKLSDETAHESQAPASKNKESDSVQFVKAAGDEVYKETETNDTSRQSGNKDVQTRALRKRKHSEGENKADSVAPKTSTYDKVRIITQPWRKPEGGVNKPILKMMLESVMLYLMMKPGSTEQTLIYRYSPYLQPMVLKNIIEILEDIGCVKQQFVTKKKPSLFSKPVLPIVAELDTEGSLSTYMPTEDCLFRLGQFGMAMYPDTEWPSSASQ